VWEKRNAYRDRVANPEGTNRLIDLDTDETIILNCILKK
jgi:hypothetical protein